MVRTAVMLQARMASTRLPGKALAEIAGRTVLGHCLWRLLAGDLPVIVATRLSLSFPLLISAIPMATIDDSRRPEIAFQTQWFTDGGTEYGTSEIVRVTGDNPAVDMQAAARSLALRRRGRADHVTEGWLPLGAAVEAVTIEALAYAHALANDPYDREHVTPFVRQQPMFTTLCSVAPAALRRPDVRLTVDTVEDLEFMRAVLEPFRHARRPPALAEIIQMADVQVADVARRGHEMRARRDLIGAADSSCIAVVASAHVAAAARSASSCSPRRCRHPRRHRGGTVVIFRARCCSVPSRLRSPRCCASPSTGGARAVVPADPQKARRLGLTSIEPEIDAKADLVARALTLATSGQPADVTRQMLEIDARASADRDEELIEVFESAAATPHARDRGAVLV
jgi:spore coat polysaccharide biosynthesis protein SpsF (cytidylyltransferase family)